MLVLAIPDHEAEPDFLLVRWKPFTFCCPVAAWQLGTLMGVLAAERGAGSASKSDSPGCEGMRSRKQVQRLLEYAQHEVSTVVVIRPEVSTVVPMS